MNYKTVHSHRHSKPFVGQERYYQGRVYIYTKEGRYTTKARVVMELELGRKLLPQERVHHKDRVKIHDIISNLELKKSSEEHSLEHMKANSPFVHEALVARKTLPKKALSKQELEKWWLRKKIKMSFMRYYNLYKRNQRREMKGGVSDEHSTN